MPAPLATHTAHGAGAHSSPSAANQHAYVPKCRTKHATLAIPHSATHHTFTSESCRRVPNFRSFDGGAAPSAGDPSPTNAGFSDAMRSAPLAPGFLRTTGSVAFGGARSRWPPAPMRTSRTESIALSSSRWRWPSWSLSPSLKIASATAAWSFLESESRFVLST